MTTLSQPHPNPRLARAGITVSIGSQAAPGASGPRKPARPPLTDIMSPLRPYRAWFHELTVLAGDAIASGESAWWLLKSIDAKNAGDFLFHGADIDLRPTDPTGAATPSAGTITAWGDTNGISAAIVIERNLGLRAGQWNSRRVDLPAIENDQAAGQVTPDTARNYMIAESFPAGNFTDAVPSRTFSARRFLPAALRIARRDTLDVALVMRGTYVDTPAATRIIVGYAKVEIYTSPVIVQREWL